MHCTVLNIYRIDSLNLTKIEPHKQNPILVDCTCARNGGRIFIENGKKYRVAQNNSHGMYGYGISIREITKLSIDEYEEIEVRCVLGNEILGGIGTHHLCQIDDMFVMDVCIKQ